MNFDLGFYWRLFLARLPVMMLLGLISTGLGVITALNSPDTFTTSARLLVEAPQIPDSMVASTVQTDEVEQLDMIEQRLITRANLIDIANEFQVYEDLRQLDPDEVVAKMRRDTRIRRTAGQSRATVMSIEFTARSGPIAADVVNRYVTIVLETNTDFRVSRAEGTLRFFEQEVERLGQDLDERSLSIATFKSENADALPENQDYRLSRVTLLAERLGRMERELARDRSQRDEIIRIFEATGQLVAGETQLVSQLSQQEQQLLAAKAELDEALAIYSEINPRVVTLRQRIERLERAVASLNAAAGDTAGDISPEMALFQATLADIDGRIATTEAEAESTEAEINELEVAIARSAANGIELNSLERDYDIIQRRHETAVSNLNAARMSERIESTAQGQRITEIESASVPTQPSGPSHTKIVAFGILIGGALAIAYFLLLEVLNRSIRRPDELINRFNVMPLAVIPHMENRRARMRRIGRTAIASLAVLIGVPVGLWYVDANVVPLERVVQAGLDSLGLG